MELKTFETLYESYMLSIANYVAGVWGYGEFQQPHVLQNRIQHFFLGVHSFAPVCATNLEFHWLDMKFLCWVEVVGYYNRLADMPDSRWPKKVFKWDMSLRTEGWYNQLQQILAYTNIDVNIEEGEKVDLDVLIARLHKLNRNKWLLEAATKTKLRTFIEIYNPDNPKAIVKANLPRNQRSLISKLKVGILP